MDILLFLYPVKSFVRVFTGDYNLDPRYPEWNPGRVNEMIDCRYRQRGYQVFWLMFCSRNDRQQPAMELWSHWYRREAGDRVLSVGITYLDMIRQKQLANAKEVLAGLPQSCRLVLAGFHWSDCVSKMAKAAHQAGRSVWVDADLTDLCFASMMHGEIPIVRTEPESRYLNYDDRYAKRLRRRFRQEPWLDPANRPS